ncbi:uncharacterized protein LOC127800131 [Diospyros lotus]|uniref:uncharacterized protein LOC127800131 n=1 Tax=Diospyros lotus TaxID=55363 RepID=UPI00225B2F28|nr:uncharacterized protein LOC127800131 [Diospyros lotus]
MLVIKGKGKAGYLTGSTLSPPSTTTTYDTWEAENSTIMAWQINLMEPRIGRTYLFYKIAKEIWDSVQDMYSDLENSFQCFEIRSAIRTTRQDSTKYSKMIEKDRMFDFLHGLNYDLDEVRGRILGTKPLPSLREAFAEVRREEN